MHNLSTCPLLSKGYMFQDPWWMPETVNSTQPLCTTYKIQYIISYHTVLTLLLVMLQCLCDEMEWDEWRRRCDVALDYCKGDLNTSTAVPKTVCLVTEMATKWLMGMEWIQCGEAGQRDDSSSKLGRPGRRKIFTLLRTSVI